ncbi:hypothetical protein DPMN_109883 [Dreissena polymorpha]|uniref:Uncharacterized protein n=1 Tax=Dreissena polymorpha TaxID=45954 RepID=A0A9D4KB28_DREPO|nr:hypothetical protein DPMN_109883 [Dreissena polymorpha]
MDGCRCGNAAYLIVVIEVIGVFKDSTFTERSEDAGTNSLKTDHPTDRRTGLEPELGVFEGDLKNALSVVTKPVTSRSLDGDYIHYAMAT